MPRERFIGLAVSHAFAYYRNILRAIATWAETRRDWSFVFLNPEFDRSTLEAIKHVDAAIVAINSPDLRHALPSGLPVVDISDLVPNIAGPRAASDNALIAQMSARHFLERGLRAFGYVGQSQYYFSVERERALRSSVESAGCELAVYDCRASDYDLAPMSFLRFPNTALADWLLSLPRPAGVLTPCDLWGVEILQVCFDVGLRVPEDIAVLGVDDDELCCPMARPSLSSVILPTEAIGRRAADLIESRLDKRGQRRLKTEEFLFPPIGITIRCSTDVLAIDEPDVVSAIRFIRENCHRPIDVSDVLNEVPVSRRWLERRVRDSLGITLGGEIRRAKIELAKRLLTQTDRSIAKVVEHCGFTDLRHIEYCFHKELGLSPTQFRQRTRGQ